MTVVILGIDALDPELVDAHEHSNLVLESHRSIDTIVSSQGEPSTHELWPTIITGCRPEGHGLQLDDGVAWENQVLAYGSRIADVILPDDLQTRLGAWLLNRTEEDAFRVPATYYEDNDIETVFEGYRTTAIGIPNYVVDPEEEDREHQLRRSMGDLFQRDPEATGGHTSAAPAKFYEQCMEMAMIRIARVRRALRSNRYELVFGYTSGLDLIGHVAYEFPQLHTNAYAELNEFVGELVDDLSEEDELLLVSDHGLQDGVHTEKAMVAGTDPEMIKQIESVLEVRGTLETELNGDRHLPKLDHWEPNDDNEARREVREQLENLGYM